MPSGIYDRTKSKFNSSLFKKGHKNKNPLGKGLFKKGMTPWNKGLKGFMAGEKNPAWNGGRRKTTFGYILIYSPDHPFAIKRMKCVPEHRLVIEKQIGRYLLPNEPCHHLNKIKDDNRPENLMAFKNQATHNKFEFGIKIKSSDIIFDGHHL